MVQCTAISLGEETRIAMNIFSLINCVKNVDSHTCKRMCDMQFTFNRVYARCKLRVAYTLTCKLHVSLYATCI